MYTGTSASGYPGQTQTAAGSVSKQKLSEKQINELKIEYGKSYHYYYDLLVQLREKGENTEFNSMDQHEKLDSEITQEIVEAAFDSLPDEQKEELAEQGIGKLAGMRR
jgi:DNA-directed RNA polymerase specialized sigma24 family protein